MNIWLDDIRNPMAFGRIGYKWVKTAQEVIDHLKDGLVDRLSLDHDLGACDECMRKEGVDDPEEWLMKHDGMAMPNCPHVGTGYDVVCWMEANDTWPELKPSVHSANPVGRARMQRIIDLHYAKENQ